MTLKTSLIITGDSATAQKAVEDLNDNVRALTATSRGAIAPATQLDTAQRGVATSATSAAAATARAATATATGAIASRGAAVAQGALATATGITATSMTAAGIAAGTLEAILTGGLSIAITAVSALVGALAIKFFDSDNASKQASEGMEEFGRRQSDIANFIDFTTGKLKEQNRTLIENAVLTRQEQAARIRKDAQDTGLGAIGAVRGAVRTGSRFVAERQAQAPVYDVKLVNALGAATSARGVNIEELDRQLGALGKGYETLRKQVSQAAGQVITTEREANRLETEVRALLGDSSALKRDAKDKPSTRAGASGGTRAGGVRDLAKATNDVSAAQRQLAQDLQGVIGRYDPAKKAAAEYADELERIARLEAGGKISGSDAGQYSTAAAAAYTKKRADIFELPGIDDVRGQAEAADAASGAIAGLVASLQGELAVRQSLDPVEAAMLKHKADLLKLAPEERAAKEAEIRGLYADIDATERVADAAREAEQAKRQLQDAALGALDAIIIGGEKAGDVIKRLAGSIASAALEATLFGTGPLAALLQGGVASKSGGAGGAPAPGTGAVEPITKGFGKELDRIFGTGGSFATTLKNAGIGYAAGSITGSGTGGAIGGAVGGKIATKFLTGALGDLAGPVGSIVGGLLGGALGGLFKSKAQPGGATVSNVGGQAGASGSVGSDRAAIQAGTGLAGSVAATINQVAEQLGGAIGDFSVQIGKYKDDLRVNVNGRPLGGVTGSGATGFGSDENAAVNFAAAQAIAQGAISGVSDAVAKALRSSTSVDGALKEALKVQQIETLIGGIGGEIEKAFRDFEATAKERVRVASQYGFDVVAIEKRNAADRLRLSEDLLKGQVGSLKQLVDEITRGSLFEGSAVDRLGAIEPAIAAARADLEAGVEGAGDTLASLLQQKIGTLKDAYGTTSGYADGRNAILDEARAAIVKANAQIAAAQAKTTPTSDPALQTTNDALDENNDQNAMMLAEMRATNALLAKLQGDDNGYTPNLSELARV